MGKCKIAKILEMTSRRVKRSEIRGPRVVVTSVWGTIDPLLYVWGHLGVIRRTCVKMTCNTKTHGRTVKRSEIWESEAVFICIWGTFNILVFKVVWGSFSALVHVSQWPVTRKWLAAERNWVKFGRRVLCLYVYGGTYDMLVFKVIWGLFDALVSKCVWRIAGKIVPGFKNKKSMYEIFHYGTSSEI